jgi:glycosyltransferase involved in cell wall biosynthesis
VAAVSERHPQIDTTDSLTEVLAAGRPVVATDVGGVRSVVEDGVTGFLCPASDHQCVADRLRALLESTETRARFGAAGRRRVLERFGHERVLNEVADLYSDVLS